MLTTKGNKVYRGDKEFQLKGASIADIFLTDQKTKIPVEQTLKELKDMGNNAVRFPVIPEVLSENRDAYMDLLHVVLEYTLSLDLIPIICFHKIGEWHSVEEELKDFWRNITEYFKDAFLDRCVLEIFNEPTFEAGEWHKATEEDWDTLKPVLVRQVARLRDAGFDNLIICGTPDWDGFLYGILDNPIHKKNVAYTLHSYAGRMKNPSSWKKLLATYQEVAEKFPIVITEMGYEIGGKIEGGTKKYAEVLKRDLIDPYGMGYMFWCYSSMNGVNSKKDDKWGPICVTYVEGKPVLKSAGRTLKKWLTIDSEHEEELPSVEVGIPMASWEEKYFSLKREMKSLIDRL